MQLSFNWYKYSFILGIRKNDVRLNTTAEGYGVGETDSIGTGPLKPGFSESRRERSKPEEEGCILNLAQVVKSEIETHLKAISIKRPDKEELIFSLRRLLKPHAELTIQQAFPYRYAINNTIENGSAKHCSIQLNNEDFQILWREFR